MIFRPIKYLVFIAVLTLFFSCGKNAEEKVDNGIESAHQLLSTKQCQPAIDLLEGLGRQNRNAQYLKVLSSAYACRAQYSAITFFGSDISLTATPPPLGGMTKYSTSLQTFSAPLTNDSKFRDLQTAIDILLYAGGIPATTEPTPSERAKYFSANDAGDINTQLAFMTMVQIGRFMKVYGDAGVNGVKGGGSGSNVCFSNYPNTTAPVQTAISAQAGACKQINSPHPQLDSALIGLTERRKRLCEGAVLVNGLLEVLPAVLAAASGGDLEDISDVTDKIEDAKTQLTTHYSPGEILTVLSQTNCVTSSGITDEKIESYYALLIEGLIE